MYIYNFKLVFWVSLDVFPEVELLGHQAVLLIFGSKSILLSTVAVSICIPTNSAQGSPLSTSSPALAGWLIDDGRSGRCEAIGLWV